VKEKGILGPGQMGQCTRDLASLRMHHNVNQGTAKLGWDSSGNSQQLQQRSNLLGTMATHVAAVAIAATAFWHQCQTSSP